MAACADLPVDPWEEGDDLVACAVLQKVVISASPTEAFP